MNTSYAARNSKGAFVTISSSYRYSYSRSTYFFPSFILRNFAASKNVLKSIDK